MSSIENYDGLCGIIHLLASSDKQVRCNYELGHHGKHSWENKKVGFHIQGCTEDRYYEKNKFIESVIYHQKERIKISISQDRDELIFAILDWVLEEQLAGRRPNSVDVANHFNMTVEEAVALHDELEEMGEFD